jgi:Zn-dependent metalloprotease
MLARTLLLCSALIPSSSCGIEEHHKSEYILSVDQSWEWLARLQNRGDTLSTQQIPGASVRFDPRTGAIQALEGSVCIAGAKTPRESAERFLQSYMNLKTSDDGKSRLSLEDPKETLTSTRLIYQHYYTNIDPKQQLPIFGSTISVLVGNDNCIKRLDNNIVGITTPKKIRIYKPLRERQAIKAIERELDKTGRQSSTPPEATLGIIIVDGRPLLAWKVYLTTAKPPASLNFVVDARSGKILSSQNAAQY